MIITIDAAAAAPVYEQIRDQVADGIRSGALSSRTRLPTVRQLAGDLGLAVNTVARAYRLLEAQGYVETLGRNGTVVRSVAEPGGWAQGADDAPGEEVSAAAVLLARAAQRRGLDLDGAIGELRRAW